MAETLDTVKAEELVSQRISAMVVDDQAFVRRIVQQILRRIQPSEIVEAVDGEEALRRLGKPQSKTPGDATKEHDVRGAFDVVIVDFEMKNVNGLELLKKIRCGRTSAARDTPVIMLTGHNDETVIQKALELQVSGFVTKPVSAAGLLNRLHHALQLKFELRAAADLSAVEIPISRPDAKRDEAVATFPGASVKVADGADSLSSMLVDEDETTVAEAIKRLEIARTDPEMKQTAMALQRIPVDSILAEDLKTIRGGLLARAGTVVDENLRRKLGDLSEQKDVPRKVFVHRSNLEIEGPTGEVAGGGVSA